MGDIGIIDPSPGQLLVALLLAGHVTGEFLLQGGDPARRKAEPARLGMHVLPVALAHGFFLLFFVPWGLLLTAVVGITIAHAVVDALEPSLEVGLGRDLRALVAAQILHVLVLLGLAAWILSRGFRAESSWLPWGPGISWGIAVAVIVAGVAAGVRRGARG